MGFFQVSSTMPLTAWQLQRCHLFKAHWIDVIDMDNLIIRNCYNQLIISFINNQLTLILESFWLIQVRCDPMTSRWLVGYLIGHPQSHPSLWLQSPDVPGYSLPWQISSHPSPCRCTDLNLYLNRHSCFFSWASFVQQYLKKKMRSILNFRRWTSCLKTKEEEKMTWSMGHLSWDCSSRNLGPSWVLHMANLAPKIWIKEVLTIQRHALQISPQVWHANTAQELRVWTLSP